MAAEALKILEKVKAKAGGLVLRPWGSAPGRAAGSRALWTIVHKELGDHFTSFRFYIMFLLIGITCVAAVYTAAMTIRGTVAALPELDFVFLWLFTTSGNELPPFTSFIGFLAPLLGIALGFDAINHEQNRGTLSFVLAQPVHRDALINGKFLAALLTISLLLAALYLLIGGLGLVLIGVPPLTEEVLRIFFYLLLTMVYVAFWLSVAVLCSILFRQPATSALACIGLWLFFNIFYPLLAGLLTNALVPLAADATTLEQLRHQQLQTVLLRFSPTTLYFEASGMLLAPYQRVLGPVLREQLEGAIHGALPFGQSLALIWPHFVGLFALTLAVFAVSYVIFMRREIRAF